MNQPQNTACKSHATCLVIHPHTNSCVDDARGWQKCVHVNHDGTHALDLSEFAYAKSAHIHMSSERQSLFAFQHVWITLTQHALNLEAVGVFSTSRLSREAIEHFCAVLMQFPHPTMHTFNLLFDCISLLPIALPVILNWQPLSLESLSKQQSSIKRPHTWHSCFVHCIQPPLNSFGGCHLNRIMTLLTDDGQQPFVHLTLPCTLTRRHVKTEESDGIVLSRLLSGQWCRYLLLLAVQRLGRHIFQPIIESDKQLNSRLRALGICGNQGCFGDELNKDDVFAMLANDQHFPYLHTVRFFPGHHWNTLILLNGQPIPDESRNVYDEMYYRFYQMQQRRTFSFQFMNGVHEHERKHVQPWLQQTKARLVKDRQRLAVEREWDGIYIVLSFLRANRHHPLRDSIFSLVPAIRDFIGSSPHAAAHHHASAMGLDVTKLTDNNIYKGEDMRRVSQVTTDGVVPFSPFLACNWVPALDMTCVLPLCAPRQAEIVHLLHRFVATLYARSIVYGL